MSNFTTLRSHIFRYIKLVYLRNSRTQQPNSMHTQWLRDGRSVLNKDNLTTSLRRGGLLPILLVLVVLFSINPIGVHANDVSADTGGTRTSLSGGTIAFITDRDGNFEIYTMDGSGGNLTRLTNNTVTDMFPHISPDGQKIAFHRNNAKQELYIMNIDGTGQTLIPTATLLDGAPDWSPDGQKLAFTCAYDDISAGFHTREICTINADGTNFQRLIDNDFREGEAVWSPDGSKIAFHSERDGDLEVFVMNADGTNAVQLTNNTFSDWPTTWSPDGQKIGFISDRDGNNEIYYMNADGSSQTRVTNDAGNDLYPHFSPSSDKIAFSSDRDGDFEIYVINLDGSGLTQLTQNVDLLESLPDWWAGNAATFAISGQSPTPNRVAVDPDSSISVTFAEDIDVGSVTTETLTIRSSFRGLYTDTATIMSDTATINPTNPFFAGEKVQVVGTDAVRSTSASVLEPTQWSFNTGEYMADRCFGSFVDIGVSFATAYNSSTSWSDYDGDGDLDVLYTGSSASNTAQTKLYRNDGGDNFTDVTGSLHNVTSGNGSWGDYDNDGDPDLLLAGNNGTKLYDNDNGTFTEVTTGLPGMQWGRAAWGDYDNDGDLDILLAGRAPGTITNIYRNDGGGTFVDISAGLLPLYNSFVDWVDYDNDGDLDVMMTGTINGGLGGERTRLYRNDGDDMFVDTMASIVNVNLPMFGWGDYDGDGDLDLAIAGQAGSVNTTRLYQNTAGGFVEIAAGFDDSARGSLEWGDYDNDGDLDLLQVGGWLAKVWRNDGDNNFVDIQADIERVETGSAAWGDYDNDGDLDILHTGLYGSNRFATIYRNDDCPPADYHVDEDATGNADGSSWTDAFTNLQDALAVVKDGDRILIAEGVYYPDVGGSAADNDESASFNVPAGITIYGGFDPGAGADEMSERDWEAYPTVLSGDIDGNDTTDARGVVIDTANISGNNSDHVLFLDGTTTPIMASTKIDGVIVTAGHVSHPTFVGFGGGLYCDGSGSGGVCSPTLENVSFVGNYASAGAGLLNYGINGGDSSPTLKDVTFSNNYAERHGGGVYNDGFNGGKSNPSMTNVVFIGNVANANDGGAMNNEGSSSGESNPTLVNVVFSGNTAVNGGAINNDARNNGTVNPTLINVTMNGNAAGGSGGAIRNQSGNGTIIQTVTNAILWDNSASSGESIDNADATTTISHSTVENGLGSIANGGGTVSFDGSNSTSDPLLIMPVDPATAPTDSGNVRLQENSPAVDVGDNSAVPAGVGTDLDGNLRIANNMVDMGAFEIQPPADCFADFVDIGAGLAGVSGGAAHFVDYDLDMDDDVFITGRNAAGTRVSLLYENNGGVYSIVTTNLPGGDFMGSAWADYDGDNDLDLLLAGYTVATNQPFSDVYRNDGGGTFTPITANVTEVYNPAVAWGDFDGDNDMDFLLSGLDGSNWVGDFYRNDGNDTFTPMNATFIGRTQGNAVSGDYDDDGDIDFLLSGYTTGSSRGTDLYVNNGNSTFTRVANPVPAGTVDFGDYDFDGDLDIALVGLDNNARQADIYRNDNGTFTGIGAPLTNLYSGRAVWGDYDNDGDLDFAAFGTPGSGFTADIFRNDGSDTFTPLGTTITGVWSGDMDWGDYNGDGNLDLLIAATTSSTPQAISRIYTGQPCDIIAVDDATVGYSSTPVAIDVLANDIITGTITPTITAVGSAGNGTVAINDSQVTYTSGAGFVGSDTFTYTTTIGDASDTATVSVNIIQDPGSCQGQVGVFEQLNAISSWSLSSTYQALGQSFTMPANVPYVEGMTAYFGTIAANATITLELFEGPATGTAGTPIATATYTNPGGQMNAPDSGGLPTVFRFDNPLVLTPGNEYYFLLSGSFSPAAFTLSYAFSNQISPGNMIYKFSDDIIRDISANYDVKFSFFTCDGTVPPDRIFLSKTVGVNNSCSSSHLHVNAGTEVTYCYEVTNQGSVTLTQHTLVDDQLGTLLNNVSYSLAPGATYAFSTTAEIFADTLNVATWEAGDGAGTVITDSAEAYVSIAQTDLHIQKSADRNTAVAGDEVNFYIYYENWTSVAASDVWISDTLPAELSYVTSQDWKVGTQTPTLQNTGNVVSWYMPELPPWSYGYILLTTRLTDTAIVEATIDNQITIRSATSDSNSVDNDASASVGVAASSQDLWVEKTVDGQPMPGSSLTYYIYFSNNGTRTVNNVVLTDTLPIGASYNTHYDYYTNSTMQMVGEDLIWSIDSLAPYQWGYIYLTVDITDSLVANTVLTNTVSISGDGTDADTANNSDIVTSTVTVSGRITGTVTQGSTPIEGATVYAYRSNSPHYDGWVHTDVNGTYDLGNLPAGDYYVYFYTNVGNEVYDNVNNTAEATLVTVLSGQTTTDIDAEFDPPLPPRAMVDAGTHYATPDPSTGETRIWINRSVPSDLTFSLEVTCDNGASPTGVTLVFETQSNGTFEYPMTADGSTYSATIPAADLTHGTFNVVYDCGGVVVEEVIGHGLIDPSGIISDEVTGNPIVGATVTLFTIDGWVPKTGVADTRANTCHTLDTRPSVWNEMPPAPQLGRIGNPLADPQEIDPVQNPLLTDNTGYYAWDVAAGCWYIIVEADGYETRISPVVGVPPEVTDLHLTMTPLAAPTSVEALTVTTGDAVNPLVATIAIITAMLTVLAVKIVLRRESGF